VNNLEKRQQGFGPVVKEDCCQTPDVKGLGNEAVSNFIINAWSNSNMDRDMEKAEEARLSYVSHLDSIKELLALDDHDEQFEMVEGMVLSIEQSRVYDLCFGTGGPAYHLIIRTNHHLHNQEIIDMRFEYHDWFYKKVFPIVHGTDEWDYWEEFVLSFFDPNMMGDIL
jgi:hypothetical protein